MLTARENFLETIRGGKPERLVDQYEYMEIVVDPINLNCAGLADPGKTRVTDWGFTVSWPEGTPGPFPVHKEETILLRDITKWKEVLKAPNLRAYPPEMWEPFEAIAAGVDREENFVASAVFTGIFEKIHYFMGMEEAMISFYEEPEAMHELIGFLTDWEIECAKVQIEHIHPDALFHHDDWGSQASPFFSLEMFEEFFVPAYKKIYGFWKKNGVEIVVHHSDSYAANLVPAMIECGVDIFQGATYENNIPELLQKYGGKISIQGGVDNGKYDKENWSGEEIGKALDELLTKTGINYIIPSITQGGPGSVYPGVYEAISEEIKKLDKKYF